MHGRAKGRFGQLTRANGARPDGLKQPTPREAAPSTQRSRRALFRSLSLHLAAQFRRTQQRGGQAVPLPLLEHGQALAKLRWQQGRRLLD
ncbi:hypothetical protein D3C80_1540600 [compost metagenome]